MNALFIYIFFQIINSYFHYCSEQPDRETTFGTFWNFEVGDQQGSCDVYTPNHVKGLGVMCCGSEECGKIYKEHNTFQKSMPILQLAKLDLAPS